MAYGDIPDLIFTVDSQGNVVYSNVDTTDNNTSNNVSTSSTDKKWWEQVFGIIPGILNAILGNKAQPQTQVPQGNYSPYPSASMNSSNMTIIIIAAAVIIFLLMKNK